MIGTYKDFKISWNSTTSKWDMYVGTQKLGQASNIGGPSNTFRGTESGLETTSDKNSSPKAPVYGLQYATLSNFTWQNCSASTLYNDLPASIYWVNQPFSAETKMP